MHLTALPKTEVSPLTPSPHLAPSVILPGSVSLPPGCSPSTASMSISILGQRPRSEPRPRGVLRVECTGTMPLHTLWVSGPQSIVFKSSYIPQFIFKLNLFFLHIFFFFFLKYIIVYNVVLVSSGYHANMYSLPLTPHPFHTCSHHETLG